MQPPNFHYAMSILFVRYFLCKIYPFNRVNHVFEYGNLQTSMIVSLSYFCVLCHCAVWRDLWRTKRLVNNGGMGLND